MPAVFLVTHHSSLVTRHYFYDSGYEIRIRRGRRDGAAGGVVATAGVVESCAEPGPRRAARPARRGALDGARPVGPRHDDTGYLWGARVDAGRPICSNDLVLLRRRHRFVRWIQRRLDRPPGLRISL